MNASKPKTSERVGTASARKGAKLSSAGVNVGASTSADTSAAQVRNSGAPNVVEARTSAAKGRRNLDAVVVAQMMKDFEARQREQTQNAMKEFRAMLFGD